PTTLEPGPRSSAEGTGSPGGGAGTDAGGSIGLPPGTGLPSGGAATGAGGSVGPPVGTGSPSGPATDAGGSVGLPGGTVSPSGAAATDSSSADSIASVIASIMGMTRPSSQAVSSPEYTAQPTSQRSGMTTLPAPQDPAVTGTSISGSFAPSDTSLPAPTPSPAPPIAMPALSILTAAEASMASANTDPASPAAADSPTLPPPQSGVLTVLDQTYTATSGERFDFGSGNVLTPGGVATVSGNVLSMDLSASYVVVNGATNSLVGASPAGTPIVVADPSASPTMSGVVDPGTTAGQASSIAGSSAITTSPDPTSTGQAPPTALTTTQQSALPSGSAPQRRNSPWILVCLLLVTMLD
ncbi:hypothetical protein LTR53_009198, partial [Teratosphaeriaceae sp. CCFEE 6253]